ncbi:DNA mismatch repair endonuclease MutL [bacterium]|nr:DNA mismatch repair endonuclease MutL [bacterium]
MGRIKQLSKHLINQIAAGEVIERPASVVKELTENSIDAGATKISIDITNDCRDIRIADNGSGIHPDDIMLAFSKHATSKIATDEDLYNIHTLGFRGEALSSIISISKLTCTTRTKDFENGTKVKCENSEVKYSQTGCAVGTIMEVKDLFYNIPARLKFLKSSVTEFSYIQELVQSIALAHSECSLELKKNGKTMLKTSGQNNLLQTIKEVYSGDVTKNLKEVLKTDDLSGLKISGYVSTPNYTRSSKKSYHIYINGRSVKDAVFLKSIDTAYKALIANGKYPFIVLNLEIPPSDVDVNVHPTKKEVRYKNPNQIFNFIYTSIQGGLSNYVERQIQNLEQFKPEPLTVEEKSANVIDFSERKQEKEGIFVDKQEDTVYLSDNAFEKLEKMHEPVEQKQFFNPVIKEDEIEENIIGQYKNTYILIEKDDGLEIVDQHIAEERYNYEKLRSEKQIASQMLFISDVVSVSNSEVELIKENLEKFEKFGFGIEFTKENELIFRKVPQILAKVNPKEIIADILENIEGDIDGLEEHIMRTTACKASVKAGQKLSLWQMQEIIKKWRTTKMPYTCPHGRPITHTISHKEIAGFFERNE